MNDNIGDQFIHRIGREHLENAFTSLVNDLIPPIKTEGNHDYRNRLLVAGAHIQLAMELHDKGIISKNVEPEKPNSIYSAANAGAHLLSAMPPHIGSYYVLNQSIPILDTAYRNKTNKYNPNIVWNDDPRLPPLNKHDYGLYHRFAGVMSHLRDYVNLYHN